MNISGCYDILYYNYYYCYMSRLLYVFFASVVSNENIVSCTPVREIYLYQTRSKENPVVWSTQNSYKIKTKRLSKHGEVDTLSNY